VSNTVRIDEPAVNDHVAASQPVTVKVYAKSSSKLNVDLGASYVGLSPTQHNSPLTQQGNSDYYTGSVTAPAGAFRLYANVRFTDGAMEIEDGSDDKGPFYGDA
jgi:hypothetical protein